MYAWQGTMCLILPPGGDSLKIDASFQVDPAYNEHQEMFWGDQGCRPDPDPDIIHWVLIGLKYRASPICHHTSRQRHCFLTIFALVTLRKKYSELTN